METLKGIIAVVGLMFVFALFGVGVYLGYKSYLLFQAGQILEAMYVLMVASLFLRK